MTSDAMAVLNRIYKNAVNKGLDNLVAPTLTEKMNTASNLEHRLKTIMKNAGLKDVRGGLHTLRKTFATQLYKNGVRVEEIAAYIGDLESTTHRYYIAIRKKVIADGCMKQVVMLPEIYQKIG